MLAGVLLATGLMLLLGGLLLLAARAIPANPADPVEAVNALLPQSQCGQCGYPGCRPYAAALVEGAADIDQCAPGGEATVAALARLLGRNIKPLNPDYGLPTAPAVARIDESACIGCALCLDACPVDAIVGAHQFTHTVIEQECTGCELCVPPCPVDCIVMLPLQERQSA